jgi:hypothetical protein
MRAALVTNPSTAPKTVGRNQPPETSRCRWAHPRFHARLRCESAAASDDTALGSQGEPFPSTTLDFLGGIADVLQDKTNTRNIDLSHLGDLQAVALYHDDRQISQINYRVARADSPSSIIRITVLPDLGAIGTDIQSHDGR